MVRLGTAGKVIEACWPGCSLAASTSAKGTTAWKLEVSAMVMKAFDPPELDPLDEAPELEAPPAEDPDPPEAPPAEDPDEALPPLAAWAAPEPAPTVCPTAPLTAVTTPEIGAVRVVALRFCWAVSTWAWAVTTWAWACWIEPGLGWVATLSASCALVMLCRAWSSRCWPLRASDCCLSWALVRACWSLGHRVALAEAVPHPSALYCAWACATACASWWLVRFAEGAVSL